MIFLMVKINFIQKYLFQAMEFIIQIIYIY